MFILMKCARASKPPSGSKFCESWYALGGYTWSGLGLGLGLGFRLGLGLGFGFGLGIRLALGLGLANPDPNPNLAQETVHAQSGVDRVPRLVRGLG